MTIHSLNAFVLLIFFSCAWYATSSLLLELFWSISCYFVFLSHFPFLNVFLCSATPPYIHRLEQQFQDLSLRVAQVDDKVAQVDDKVAQVDDKVAQDHNNIIQLSQNVQMTLSCSPSPGTDPERYQNYASHLIHLSLHQISLSSAAPPVNRLFFAHTRFERFQKELFEADSNKKEDTIQSFLKTQFEHADCNIVDSHLSASIGTRKPDFTGYVRQRPPHPTNILFIGEVEFGQLSNGHRGKAISFAGLLCCSLLPSFCYASVF